MIEQFQKLQAPRFHGGSDPLVANRWKKDMGNILELISMDPIQCQRLATFSLKGDANKWYKTQFSEEERYTTTWGELIRIFDLHFIFVAVRVEKEAELLALEQGI